MLLAVLELEDGVLFGFKHLLLKIGLLLRELLEVLVELIVKHV